jgi:hypothetical protein
VGSEESLVSLQLVEFSFPYKKAESMPLAVALGIGAQGIAVK